MLSARSCSVRARRALAHEVDQLLDPAQQRGLEVGVGAHATEDALPRPRDVGLRRVRPTERLAHAVLPLGPAIHDRPRGDTEARGLHRLPDVDEWMPHHEHMRAERHASHSVGAAAFLQARYGVIYEHPSPPLGARAVVAQYLLEQVNTLEVLGHDALDAQVDATHSLDELGVV